MRAKKAAARAHAIELQQARARATARAAARAKALAVARANRTADAGALADHHGTIQLLAKVLLGVAAALLLLALAPDSAAYNTFGPRVGHVLAEGRFTLAGIGAALAVGMVVALYLGGI